jgi:voltage-gated sodium channel
MDVSRLQRYFRQIDGNKSFQMLVISVIVISALSIGAHTYRLPVWLERGLLLLDYAITVFFAVEIAIRFIASGSAKAFFSKGWNVFDTIIVVGSLIPIAGSTVLLARLLRIFRALRLISIIPELRMLVNALLKSIPRMGYIALLMFVIFYIYAAIGSIIYSPINPEHWGDVGISMLTMFRIATFESWALIMYETMEVYPLSWIFFVSFIFIGSFIFLNMMVGTILDVMAKESKLMDNELQPEQLTPASLGDIEELKQQIAELKTLLERR